MQRTRAPVLRSSIRACCAVSQTFQRARSASLSSINAITCSKAIRACSKLDATRIVSPRGTIKGPSRVAAAIPDNNAVFPLPPRHAKGRRLHARRKGPANETPLPGQYLERLPSKAALRDGQPGEIGNKVSRHSY